MEERFDYTKAVEDLEAIAAKVEDPQTPIGDMEACMKRSGELVAACRAYLRGVRDRLDGLMDE